MAPEYAFRGLFSTKSDVFSFGIMVLEIVSGKKSISFQDKNNIGLTLIGHVSLKRPCHCILNFFYVRLLNDTLLLDVSRHGHC